MMRQGILLGYFHANEHPSLVCVLIANMTTLVQRMGLFAVKHLKDILPILSGVLTDPFAGVRLERLSVALDALKVVCLNCWMRIGEPVRRVEVVRALVGCWGTLDVECEGDAGMVERIREEARTAGRVFVKAVEGFVDMRVELEPLLEVNQGLGELFGFEKD